MKKTPIYITGHQHPDTDSVVSAIAYSFFKRSQGVPTVPCRLGKLNGETRYLLDRFGFPEPQLLTDARVTLGEVAMDPPSYITPDTTIFESLQQMQQFNRTYCGVVDESKNLIGFFTKSDISVIGLYDTARSIAIMAQTPLENFRKTLDGRIVYDDPAMELNGKVSVIAMTEESRLQNYDVEKRIVICGNDPAAQETVIRKGAGMLVVVWAQDIAPQVIDCAKQYHCPILISGHGGMNTLRYIYFSPSVSQIMKTELVRFTTQELAEDVGRKMLQSRFHVYPVTDPSGKLFGYVSRYHIMQAPSKQLILVDHNEFPQSVRAIEKAQVLEVIDHHRISDFSSQYPVQFRNEIVGSTCTIVATIFRENQIPIPVNLAGLMLGAILSDTLNFHSPTTTEKDRSTANILSAIADLDLEEFGTELFTATASKADTSPEELIKADMKIFEVWGCKLSISQVILATTEDLHLEATDIEAALDRFAEKKDLDLTVLAFTSIQENGSILYFGGNRTAWGKEAFPEDPTAERTFHQGLLSRKQQLLPQLTSVIEKYA